MDIEAFALILGGLVALVAGGDLLVRGAVALARRFGMSPMVIGVTLVGFGTSTPELVTSLQAALAGSPAIAVGNVVGSNIANVFLILGLAALLAPIAVSRAEFQRDGGVLVAATLLALAIVMTGALGRWAGAGLIAALAIYLFWVIRSGHSPAVPDSEIVDITASTTPVAVSLGLFAVGLVLTIIGARWLVSGAVTLAAAAGMSEAVIGLTLVAVGTSLPELVTSVIAARRGEGAVAFGNIIGSNIFNILGILGVTALVRPLQVPPEIMSFDIWVMVASTFALTAAAVTGWLVTRREGMALIAVYALYLGWLIL